MSLYLEHFGLREPAFRITPHTDFFYAGAQRGPTLDALIYAITQDEGIVKITGEVGSGKTMLCRMLLERLPDEVETLYLANPSLSRHEILGAIADELGIPAEGKVTHSLTRALQDALIARHAQGQRVVLLIDEAHSMPAESLEEIRLLSNLETKAAKLLRIALFAQPELDERLAAKDMRQLRERITQHFNLTPLTPDDVAAYLDFRLRAAGYRGPTPFTPAAIEKIARISEGLSRRINILADKALLAAFSQNSHRVDLAEVDLAVRDAHFSPLTAATTRPRPALQAFAWGAAGAASIALIMGSIWLLLPSRDSAPVTGPLTAAATTTPVAKAVDNPPPAVAPAAQLLQDASDRIRFGTLTRQHLQQFDAWIAEAPRTHYFIQLLATDAQQTGQIEGFLARATQALDPALIRVYRSALSGRDRIGIIYGEFPTREAAVSAMLAMPESIKAAQPFPRQVVRLR